MKLFRDGVLLLGLIKKIAFFFFFLNFMQTRCIVLLKGKEFGFVKQITPLWCVGDQTTDHTVPVVCFCWINRNLNALVKDAGVNF